MNEIIALRGALLKLRDTSKLALVQFKCRKAAADLHRAQTLIEKAQQTLAWAQQYNPNHATE